MIFVSDTSLWFIIYGGREVRRDLVQSPNNDSSTKPKDKYSLWNGACKQTSWSKQTDSVERKHLGEFRLWTLRAK